MTVAAREKKPGFCPRFGGISRGLGKKPGFWPHPRVAAREKKPGFCPRFGELAEGWERNPVSGSTQGSALTGYCQAVIDSPRVQQTFFEKGVDKSQSIVQDIKGSRKGTVVQLVRAPPCHGGSCGFEPRQSRLKYKSGYAPCFPNNRGHGVSPCQRS